MSEQSDIAEKQLPKDNAKFPSLMPDAQLIREKAGGKNAN